MRCATVDVAGRHYGLDVADVQEVAGGLPMTFVPLAPPAVAGVVNLRGRVVPVVDLAARLGLPTAGPAMHVVVRTDDGLVSLLVDAAGDVVDVDEDLVERVPDTVPAGERDVLRGVAVLVPDLLLLLDLPRLLCLTPDAPASMGSG